MDYDITEGWAGGNTMNAYRILVGNHLANRSVVWPRRTWEDKMVLYNSIAKGYEAVVWHIGLLAFLALSLV